MRLTVALVLTIVVLAQEARKPVFWSLRPPVKTPGTIDSFIVAKLQAKNLDLAPKADERTLIRRLSFDLTGLPPTPDSTNSLTTKRLSGCSHRAITASAGAATGSTSSATARPTAGSTTTSACTPGATATTSSRSFNDDKPYDQFIREQIAGDLLPAARQTPTTRLLATGFLVAGPWDQVALS